MGDTLQGFPPRLLALSESCPPQMQNRDYWSIRDFVLVREVGTGAASTVYYGVCRKSCLPCAVKMYTKSKLTRLNRHQVEREVNIHSSLRHPHIIDFYAAFEDDERVYLIMEFAAGGDLFDEVKRRGGRLPEAEVVRCVLYPYLCALAYLHGRGIIHRDIKPENTVFTRDKVMKVTDFGLAVDSCTERPVTRLGTLDYMAPEVLMCPDKHAPDDNKHRPDLAYGPEVDAWAMGVLAYELIVGRPPFGMSCRDATMRAIAGARPAMPEWLTPGAADFISGALAKDPASRSRVPHLLQHPWILAHTRTTLYRQPAAAASGDSTAFAMAVAHAGGSGGATAAPNGMVQTASSFTSGRPVVGNAHYLRATPHSLAAAGGACSTAEAAALAAVAAADAASAAAAASVFAGSAPNGLHGAGSGGMHQQVPQRPATATYERPSTSRGGGHGHGTHTRLGSSGVPLKHSLSASLGGTRGAAGTGHAAGHMGHGGLRPDSPAQYPFLAEYSQQQQQQGLGHVQQHAGATLLQQHQQQQHTLQHPALAAAALADDAVFGSSPPTERPSKRSAMQRCASAAVMGAPSAWPQQQQQQQQGDLYNSGMGGASLAVADYMEASSPGLNYGIGAPAAPLPYPYGGSQTPQPISSRAAAAAAYMAHHQPHHMYPMPSLYAAGGMGAGGGGMKMAKGHDARYWCTDGVGWGTEDPLASNFHALQVTSSIGPGGAVGGADTTRGSGGSSGNGPAHGELGSSPPMADLLQGVSAFPSRLLRPVGHTSHSTSGAAPVPQFSNGAAGNGGQAWPGGGLGTGGGSGRLQAQGYTHVSAQYVSLVGPGPSLTGEGPVSLRALAAVQSASQSVRHSGGDGMASAPMQAMNPYANEPVKRSNSYKRRTPEISSEDAALAAVLAAQAAGCPIPNLGPISPTGAPTTHQPPPWATQGTASPVGTMGQVPIHLTGGGSVGGSPAVSHQPSRLGAAGTPAGTPRHGTSSCSGALGPAGAASAVGSPAVGAGGPGGTSGAGGSAGVNKARRTAHDLGLHLQLPRSNDGTQLLDPATAVLFGGMGMHLRASSHAGTPTKRERSNGGNGGLGADGAMDVRRPPSDESAGGAWQVQSHQLQQHQHTQQQLMLHAALLAGRGPSSAGNVQTSGGAQQLQGQPGTAAQVAHQVHQIPLSPDSSFSATSGLFASGLGGVGMHDLLHALQQSPMAVAAAAPSVPGGAQGHSPATHTAANVRFTMGLAPGHVSPHGHGHHLRSHPIVSPLQSPAPSPFVSRQNSAVHAVIGGADAAAIAQQQALLLQAMARPMSASSSGVTPHEQTARTRLGSGDRGLHRGPTGPLSHPSQGADGTPSDTPLPSPAPAAQQLNMAWGGGELPEPLLDLFTSLLDQARATGSNSPVVNSGDAPVGVGGLAGGVGGGGPLGGAGSGTGGILAGEAGYGQQVSSRALSRQGSSGLSSITGVCRAMPYGPPGQQQGLAPRSQPQNRLAPAANTGPVFPSRMGSTSSSGAAGQAGAGPSVFSNTYAFGAGNAHILNTGDSGGSIGSSPPSSTQVQPPVSSPQSTHMGQPVFSGHQTIQLPSLQPPGQIPLQPMLADCPGMGGTPLPRHLSLPTGLNQAQLLQVMHGPSPSALPAAQQALAGAGYGSGLGSGVCAYGGSANGAPHVHEGPLPASGPRSASRPSPLGLRNSATSGGPTSGPSAGDMGGGVGGGGLVSHASVPITSTPQTLPSGTLPPALLRSADCGLPLHAVAVQHSGPLPSPLSPARGSTPQVSSCAADALLEMLREAPMHMAHGAHAHGAGAHGMPVCLEPPSLSMGIATVGLSTEALAGGAGWGDMDMNEDLDLDMLLDNPANTT